MRSALILTVLLALALLLVSGCTTAGPFVTDIGYDGEGNLVITKNSVKYDAFFGTVSTADNEQITVLKTPKP